MDSLVINVHNDEDEDSSSEVDDFSSSSERHNNFDLFVMEFGC